MHGCVSPGAYERREAAPGLSNMADLLVNVHALQWRVTDRT